MKTIDEHKTTVAYLWQQVEQAESEAKKLRNGAADIRGVLKIYQKAIATAEKEGKGGFDAAPIFVAWANFKLDRQAKRKTPGV